MHTHLLPALLFLLPLTHAWGSFGHRTVGYLAQQYLSAPSLLFVSRLLANDHNWDISDAAIWADGSVARHRPETKQWHYIDAQDSPPSFCRLNYTQDCNKNGTPGCVVSAISNMTRILLNTSAEAGQMKEALMFLIHFIGDVHQPLHTEELSRGGNGIHVCFGGQCGERVNLHSVWDSYVPMRYRDVRYGDHITEKVKAKFWAKEIYKKDKEQRKDESGSAVEEGECRDVEDPQGCALTWASESNGFVCSYVLKPGVEWLKTHDLGGEYYEGATVVVEAMIAKAGKRLGHWINAIVEARSEYEREMFVEAGKNLEL